MNKQKELIEAVRKGESVRIIRGEVDGMKVLEWIEKNLPEVMHCGRKPTYSRIECVEVFSIARGNRLVWTGFDLLVKFDHTFQASDLLDYDRQGPIIERGGKHWQEVVPGQIISGEVLYMVWDDCDMKNGRLRASRVSCVIPETICGNNWVSGSQWKHLALPVTPPAPKKITMSELMEIVGDTLKEKIGGEFEIVEDGV